MFGRLREVVIEHLIPAIEEFELEHNELDEIATTLHDEMPWKGLGTEELWQGLRRSAREGLRGL